MFLRQLLRFLLSFALSQNWLTIEDLIGLYLQCDGGHVCCSETNNEHSIGMNRTIPDEISLSDFERELDDLQRIYVEAVDRSRHIIDLIQGIPGAESKAVNMSSSVHPSAASRNDSVIENVDVTAFHSNSVGVIHSENFSDTGENVSSTFIPNMLDNCSFGICVDDVPLHTNGAAYHLISRVFPSTLSPYVGGADNANETRRTRCKLAFVLTGMPHTAIGIQSSIIQETLSQLRLTFGGFLFWNFHAHSKLTDTYAEQWINSFKIWTMQLSSEDIVIIRAPYKDDDLSLELCEQSIVISGSRSIEDVAALRSMYVQNNTEREMMNVSDYERSSGNSKQRMSPLVFLHNNELLGYVRSVILHYKRWKQRSDLSWNMDGFLKESQNQVLEQFVKQICTALLSREKENVCFGEEFWKSVLGSDRVTNGLEYANNNEDQLASFRNHVSQEDVEVQDLIRRTFRSWIEAQR